MNQEINSLHQNDTWKLVKPPANKRLVDCKWVYKIKPGLKGFEQPRFKARLVAKGFTQEEEIYFNEVFSRVVRHTSIRALLYIVVHFDLELEQMDVTNAFLYGTLEENIYMKQPLGYTEDGKENLVCHLQKSIYGLKQSLRQWNKRFDTFITSKGFVKSHFDCCADKKEVTSNIFVLLLLYVDDILIASQNMAEIEKIKQQFVGEFEIKNLGVAKRFLGMELKKDRQRSSLTFCKLLILIE